MIPEFSESDLEKIVKGWGNAPDKAILFEKESAVITYIYQRAEIRSMSASLSNIAYDLKYNMQDTSKLLENLRGKGLVRIFEGNKNCSLTVTGLNHFESEKQIYTKLIRAISRVGIAHRTDRIEIPDLTKELRWGDYGLTLRYLEGLKKSNIVSMSCGNIATKKFYAVSFTKKGEALLRYINSKL